MHPFKKKAQLTAAEFRDALREAGFSVAQGWIVDVSGKCHGFASHLAAAIGLALVENGWRVLFTRTSDLVQRLQIARRELALESAIAKLDKYHLLILDDIAYVNKDQAETSVLFELIGSRYNADHLQSVIRRMGQGVPGADAFMMPPFWNAWCVVHERAAD
jgi:DNA replication protein DnaC